MYCGCNVTCLREIVFCTMWAMVLFKSCTPHLSLKHAYCSCLLLQCTVYMSLYVGGVHEWTLSPSYFNVLTICIQITPFYCSICTCYSHTILLAHEPTVPSGITVGHTLCSAFIPLLNSLCSAMGNNFACWSWDFLSSQVQCTHTCMYSFIWLVLKYHDWFMSLWN